MRQIPFLRILIPFISGILFCKFISPSLNLFLLVISGLAIMLISFFTSKNKNYALRWLFGAGLMLFLFSLTTQYYQYRLEQVSYCFPPSTASYIGEVLDIPQQKKRSVACEVHLSYPVDRKIMLYLEPDSNCQTLEPGDELLVRTQIKPFKNLGNPDEFDYESFMHNKGFSGSAYSSSINWVKTGQRSSSLKTEALCVRARVLKLFNSFNLDDEAYSFISALTLGYKADLSDDLKEAFRASGTSHVLAVSGMHVGIIYIIIISLFSFLGKRGKALIFKHVLVLLCLWGYVFIIGMPVSVVRAAIMLSLVSVGNIVNRKGLTYNTLAVTAFFILIINPFYLFDVGFQLSFAAVISILFFQPKLSKLYTPKNKVVDYIWSLFTISLAAQLGVFPLGLYYFGTFPTYFFITNLLVLPFITVIIYSVVLLTFLSLLSFLNFGFLQILYNVINAFTQFLIKAVLQTVYFFESLPLSVFEGYHISALQVFLIFAIILSLSYFILRKHANQLIVFLVSVALLLVTHTLSVIKQPVDQFVVYNSYGDCDMAYRIKGERIALPISFNQTISHPSASIVLLTENRFKYKESNHVLPVDFLILASDNSFSVLELLAFFDPKKIVVDASIGRYTAAKMRKECEKLNIAFHDISNSGAFVVNF